MIDTNIPISELILKLKNIPFFNKLNTGSLLQGIDFFTDLDKTTLKKISQDIILHEFQPDEIICRHGMFSDRFYIILSGTAKAIISTESSPQYELFRLGEGEFFGEEIIYSSDPRENTIIAVDNLFAVSIDPDNLKIIDESSEKIRGKMDSCYIDRKLRRDLRSIPIFTKLNDDLFDEVLQKIELFSLPENETIFKLGDEGDAFYLIRDGEVNVYIKDNQLIAILGEGQFFGEMSLLSKEVRNATITTSKQTNFVKLSRTGFLSIIERDKSLQKKMNEVVSERKENFKKIAETPNMALVNRKLLDLNKSVNVHLDIISQCTIETEFGSALLATMPGSRYPYVYPRDSACASRLLYNIIKSPLRSGKTAFRLLSNIARFIHRCQREDGYWGQRYSITGEDKGIYKQEDNVAHGIIILCRYLLSSKRRKVNIPDTGPIIDSIIKGAEFARDNYYRNEIHLFYSTTSIHESAIEEGYSIWVNNAYLLMLRLMEQVGNEYDVLEKFSECISLKNGLESIIGKVFSLQGRFVRRLKPDGVVDLRPDITLLSPFFFGTGNDQDYFLNDNNFLKTIAFVENTLWDPDLGMLQRYLPFIEDPDTHIHAGNGPWIQYTAMLAQYYYYNGNIEKGNEIMDIIDNYRTKEGYLCEHLTTAERFLEFNKLEWTTGRDFEKEFYPSILISDITYDNVVEELNHMKNAYSEIHERILSQEKDDFIRFATPLMWSHAEYAMAMMLKAEKEIAELSKVHL